MNESFSKHTDRTAGLFELGRRPRSGAREPLRSIEHAMDIAIGAEPWTEEEAA